MELDQIKESSERYENTAKCSEKDRNTILIGNALGLISQLTQWLKDNPATAPDDSFVPTERTVNNKALTTDIYLNKNDIGLPNTPNLDTSTTANITDSPNKRFITDELLSKITAPFATPNNTVNGKAIGSNPILTKVDIGLGNVPDVNTTNTININDSPNKRFVTEAEKSAIASAVPNSRTVNGKALSSNITISKADVGLENVPNIDPSTTANIESSTDKRFVTDAMFEQLQGGIVTPNNTVNGKPLSSNPVLVKADVGLTNVDDTSDLNKPVSTAQQAAINLRVPNTRTVNGKSLNADITLVKADVGLGNVDNTSDANKPVSTATQTALNQRVTKERKTLPDISTPGNIHGTIVSDKNILTGAANQRFYNGFYATHVSTNGTDDNGYATAVVTDLNNVNPEFLYYKKTYNTERGAGLFLIDKHAGIKNTDLDSRFTTSLFGGVRVGDFYTNVFCSYTGKQLTYRKVTTYTNWARAITDADLPDITPLVIKVGSEYFLMDEQDIDVRMFGVVADDTTDNSVNLQRAFNAVARWGKNLIFPAGIIRFSTTIQVRTSNIRIPESGINEINYWALSLFKGAGERYTYLRYDGAADTAAFRVNEGAGTLSGGGFQDITFMGNGTANAERRSNGTNMLFHVSGRTVKWERCGFRRCKIAILLHNDAGTTFTEFAQAKYCSFVSCNTPLEYRMGEASWDNPSASTSGRANSFHGSGLVECNIVLDHFDNYPIKISKNCLPYNAPMSFWCWTANNVNAPIKTLIGNQGHPNVSFFGVIKLETLNNVPGIGVNVDGNGNPVKHKIADGKPILFVNNISALGLYQGGTAKFVDNLYMHPSAGTTIADVASSTTYEASIVAGNLNTNTRIKQLIGRNHMRHYVSILSTDGTLAYEANIITSAPHNGLTGKVIETDVINQVIPTGYLKPSFSFGGSEISELILRLPLEGNVDPYGKDVTVKIVSEFKSESMQTNTNLGAGFQFFEPGWDSTLVKTYNSAD